MVSQVKDLGKWIHEGRCESLTLDHLNAFLDSYAAAYPRDGEATQSLYVARSYLAYYQGDYASFHDRMTRALDAHDNLPLALSVCSQFTVMGSVDQGCECFRKYRYMLDSNAYKKRTLTQKLFRQSDTYSADYKAETDAVCAAAKMPVPERY